MKFNPSMLKKFQSCNLQYKLAQEYPDVIELKSAAASFGTLVHKCIEMYLLGRPIEDCLDFFKMVWDNPVAMDILPDYYPQRTSHEAYRQRGIEAIEGYHENQKWLNREIIGTEIRFQVPLGNHTISGIVDNVQFDPDTNTLICEDLKTGSRPNFDNLRADLQMTSYWYAIQQREFWVGWEPEIEKYAGVSDGENLFKKFIGSDIRVVWYDARKHKEYDVGQRDQRDIDRMIYLCDSIERAIREDVYVPTITGDSCKFCAYQDVCPSFVGV